MNWNLKEFKKDIEPYYDEFGCIAQKAPGRDGGDSCHRNSLIVVALAALKEKEAAAEQYYKQRYFSKNQFFRYIRHPDPNKWYSRAENFSRDQTSMLLAAAVSVEDKATPMIIKSYLVHFKGFHQNTHPNYVVPGDADYKEKTPDIVLPSELAAFCRDNGTSYLYPILCFLDSFFFLDIMFAWWDDYKSKKTSTRTDQYTMLCTHLLLAKIKTPTPVSWLEIGRAHV